MGKLRLIPLIIRTSRGHKHFGEWRTRTSVNAPAHGKATPENLSAWRDHFNTSLLKGGCNEHIGIGGWIQERIEVYNQRTGEILCTFNPPMFEIIPNDSQLKQTDSHSYTPYW